MFPPPSLVTAARILVKLSQSELAAQAGIGIATLGRYERGETNPRVDILDAILRALSAHGVYFIGETDRIAFGVLVLKQPVRGEGEPLGGIFLGGSSAIRDLGMGKIEPSSGGRR